MLVNGIKYSPLEKQIEVNVEALASEVKVSIKDKGIGISPEKIPHLFDRYFRIENTSQNYSGLGLGLYISSQIINKHGGKIGAESEPNQGSSFWFTLPTT